jgi:lipoate-protein ligase A
MQRLITQIMVEFAQLYDLETDGLLRAQRAYANSPELYLGSNWVVGALPDSMAADEPQVEKGVKELQVRRSAGE